MINLLLGAPGGGKSYEAVVYHILPALASGRRVITNLSLNLLEFPPEQRDLIEIRTVGIGEYQSPSAARHRESALNRLYALRASRSMSEDGDQAVGLLPARAFSTPECYGSDWRHPEKGFGPLYVIDECHLALPRTETMRSVAEWYSLHRHQQADVLLITQSYGKVCKDIVDLVQTVYYVRKAVALGSMTRYIRKVQDGIKGAVVSTEIRTYQQRFFRFYKSHTMSSQAAAELMPNDIRPFWKHWSVIGAGLFFLVAIVMGASGALNPFPKEKKLDKLSHAKPAKPPVTQVKSQGSPPESTAASLRKDLTGERTPNHPFYRHDLHISGFMQLQSGERYMYGITASQNGQKVFDLTSDELRQAGYLLQSIGPCAILVSYGEYKDYLTCDAPQVGVRRVYGTSGGPGAKVAAAL